MEGGGYTYKEISEDEARFAFYLGARFPLHLFNHLQRLLYWIQPAFRGNEAKAYAEVIDTQILD
jgi:hypothetical protein